MSTPFARTFSRLLVLCLMALGVCRAAENDGAVLRSARDLRKARLVKGDSGQRVEITVTVNRLPYPYDNPDRFNAQDETGGLSVLCAKRPDGSFAKFPATVQVGMRVRVEGYAFPGEFGNSVRLDDPPRVEVLGKGELPPYRTVTREDILSGSLDCMRAEVEGILRAVYPAENKAEVMSNGLRVFCHGWSMRSLEGKVGARVRIGGICFPFYNSARQVLGIRITNSMSDRIPIEHRDSLAILVPPTPAESVPVCTSRELFTSSLDLPVDEPVRARGAVLFHQPGSAIYLRDADGGLRVGCSQTKPIQPGDSVEVLGFPARGELSPTLQDAAVMRVASGPPPQPIPLRGAELLNVTHEADLVSTEARIVDVAAGPGGLALLLRVDAESPAIMATLATLPSGAGLDLIKPGAVAQVRGILSLTAGQGFEGLGTRVAGQAAILLRSLDDVSVTRPAPWWTTKRIFTVLGCVVVLALASSVWGMMLRRRVEVQTEIIRAKVQRESVHEDRLRIARELHDTLAQELHGLGRQAQAVAGSMESDPNRARSQMEQLRELIRISQNDARNAVWDLRDTALNNGDLATALRIVASRVTLGTEAQVQVDVAPEVPVSLPRAVESNLLRVAQEAVANAAGHGQATQVHIRIGMQEGKLHIAIEDNGRGFDTAELQVAQSGRFGVFGMRERIEKLAGKFDIESEPGRGTTIRAAVPIPADPADTSHT